MDEKTKRNREIYKKNKNGATYRELSVEYDLSIQRIWEILKRERQREN